jgi:hypothetical protein
MSTVVRPPAKRPRPPPHPTSQQSSRAPPQLHAAAQSAHPNSRQRPKASHARPARHHRGRPSIPPGFAPPECGGGCALRRREIVPVDDR